MFHEKSRQVHRTGCALKGVERYIETCYSNILLRDIEWEVFFCFISVGDLCAAKYVDDQWYRAKVEKLSGNDANILYVDYGNRATISKSKCASLPGAFTGLPPYAKEYTLALCSLAQDVSHLVIRFQSLRILFRSLPWFFSL